MLYISSGNDCYIANWKITMFNGKKNIISMVNFYSYIKLLEGNIYGSMGVTHHPRKNVNLHGKDGFPGRIGKIPGKKTMKKTERMYSCW